MTATTDRLAEMRRALEDAKAKALALSAARWPAGAAPAVGARGSASAAGATRAGAPGVPQRATGPVKS